MTQPYSTAGFYKTPATKATIILGSALSSSLILLGPHYQNLFVCSTDVLLGGQQLWRLATCKLAFHEIHSLILGASLFYHFRVLERRYGSAKFISYLLANTLMCVGLEVAAFFTLRSLEFNVFPRTLCGPQGILFSLFVPFILDIPSVATQNNFAAELLTGKWVSYALGVYLTTLTHTSPLVMVYGLLSGLLYRLNFLYIKSWTRLPSVVRKLCRSTLGYVFSSRPPTEGPIAMGATLEIQRQQRMEYLEQRMLLAQAQRYRGLHRQNATRRPFRQQQVFPFASRHSAGDIHRNQENGADERIPNGGPGTTSHPAASPSPEMPSTSSSSTLAAAASQSLPQEAHDIPSTSNGNLGSNSNVPEERVQQLVDMGFNRGAVMRALTMSNNDVTMATTILLQE